MITHSTCPKCGASLSARAPEGLCAKCLLASIITAGSDEIPAGDPQTPGARPLQANDAKKFGDYELLREIARGGMGVVYAARHSRLDRLVALKLIASGELSSPDLVERFKLEAKTAASLEHPNIVPIYEVGEHQNQHFIAMRLVEGGRLDERSLPLPS